jgi:hypothetical protein
MDPQRGSGGPGGDEDGLFEADRPGDGVAQRLRPGGQRLHPLHRGAFVGGAAEEPVPGEDEQRGGGAEHRPAGQAEHHEPDHRGERAASGQEAGELRGVRTSAPPGHRRLGREAAHRDDEQRDAAAARRPGNQPAAHGRRGVPGRHCHTPVGR